MPSCQSIPSIPGRVRGIELQNPLEMLSTVAQIQGLREQTETRRLAAEEARRHTRQQQIDQALQEPVTFDPATGQPMVDYGKLTGHLPPGVLFEVRQQLAEDAERLTKARTSSLALEKEFREVRGSSARTIRAADYDPKLFHIEANVLRNAGALTPEQYAAALELTDPAQIRAVLDNAIAQAGGEAERGVVVGAGQRVVDPVTGRVIVEGQPAAATATSRCRRGAAVRRRWGTHGLGPGRAVRAARGADRPGHGPAGKPMCVRESQAVGRTRGSAAGEAGGVKLSAARRKTSRPCSRCRTSAKRCSTASASVARVGRVAGRTGAIGARFGRAAKIPNASGISSATFRARSRAPRRRELHAERTGDARPLHADHDRQRAADQGEAQVADEFITAKRENTLRVASGEYTPRDGSTAPAAPPPPASGTGGGLTYQDYLRRRGGR